MSRELSVAEELTVPVPVTALWALVTEPESQERFEPRVRLASKSEGPVVPGSHFVLTMRGLSMRYETVEVEPERLVAWRVVLRNRVSTQQGEFLRDGESATRLRWTVGQQVSWPMRWLVERMCRKELKKWLDSVRREATL